MKSSRVTLLLLLFMAAALLTASIGLMSSNLDHDPCPAPTVDSELSGHVDTVYSQKEKEVFHWKQVSYHEDGVTPKVVKTCYKNRMPFLHPNGNFVHYHYYREDGTLQRLKHVPPEPHLNASIICKFVVVEFAEDGTSVLERRFYRPNDKLGVVADEVEGRFITYRSDGKTLRSVQFNDGKNTVQQRYCKDGKNIWWEHTYQRGPDRCVVHFKHDGSPSKFALMRELLWDDDVVIVQGQNEFETNNIDTYEDENGVRTHRQTWLSCWDENDKVFRIVLQRVEVFDGEGKDVVRDITYQLLTSGKQVVQTDTQKGTQINPFWLEAYGLNTNGHYDDDSLDP